MPIIMLVFVNYAHFNKKCRNCASTINGKQTLEKSQTSKRNLRKCNSFSDNFGMSNDLQHTRTPSWATDLVLRMR